jgi:hypothetical protein
MEFEKPLKVFLSYSHRDDPELFLEFRNHLTSLEDDGIIKVWSDRDDITAGLNWDQEIKKSRHECDLFLALTSASFNASGYIRGVEMRTALERNEAGRCRIIPIMWRDWRPPETLAALQFLPSRDRPVASSKDKDAVLRTLTAKIELVVKEMTKKQWKPRRPTLSAIPSELAYLCNWTGPILQLNGLRAVPGFVRRPAVLVLICTLNDCADEFLKRTYRADLPLALDLASAPVHDMRPLDWPPIPDVASGFLHRCLDARPEWEIERKLREGLTAIRTVTLGWDDAKEAVLEHTLREWSEPAWILPGNRCLLLVISVINSHWLLSAQRNGSIRKRLEGLAKRHLAIATTIVTLPKIEREHALNWPVLPEVRVYHRDREESLTDHIRRLYRWRRTVAMKRLAPKLLRILQQHRQQGHVA